MTKNVPTKTLTDAFPDWFTGDGIFSEMEDMPWDEEVSADLLDMDYFGNHSGWKKCSPLVYKLFTDDYELSDTSREKLADLVVAKFKPNWVALWNSYHFEYDPISDYDISESGEREGVYQKSRSDEKSGSKSGSGTSSTTHGHTISENNSTDIDDDTTLTHGEVIDDVDVANARESSSRYGFNSTEAVPTDEREVHSGNTHSSSHSGDDRTVRDGTIGETKSMTHGGTDSGATATTETQLETSGMAEVGNDADEYSKHFRGLKGDIPRQELIAKERELWRESFFEQVYSDIDSVLASLIYNREHRICPYAYIPFGYYAL